DLAVLRDYGGGDQEKKRCGMRDHPRVEQLPGGPVQVNLPRAHHSGIKKGKTPFSRPTGFTIWLGDDDAVFLMQRELRGTAPVLATQEFARATDLNFSPPNLLAGGETLRVGARINPPGSPPPTGRADSRSLRRLPASLRRAASPCTRSELRPRSSSPPQD